MVDCSTDLIEEEDEIEGEGDEKSQEPQIIEVPRKVVLRDREPKGS